jgi:hypothetical protein
VTGPLTHHHFLSQNELAKRSGCQFQRRCSVLGERLFPPNLKPREGNFKRILLEEQARKRRRKNGGRERKENRKRQEEGRGGWISG